MFDSVAHDQRSYVMYVSVVLLSYVYIPSLSWANKDNNARSLLVTTVHGNGSANHMGCVCVCVPVCLEV